MRTCVGSHAGIASGRQAFLFKERQRLVVGGRHDDELGRMRAQEKRR